MGYLPWDPWGYPGVTTGQLPWYYGERYRLARGEPLIRSIKRTQDPSIEPVTLAEAKSHERVDTDADDTLIESFITISRELAEEHTGRAFITQEWELIMDYAPTWFDIPRPPLQSVEEILLFQEDGSSEVVPTSVYGVDTVSTPGRVYLNLGSVWEYYRPVAGFSVSFVAGYGDNASDVPYAIREAILQILGHLYENRESQSMPYLAKNILNPYKVFYL